MNKTLAVLCAIVFVSGCSQAPQATDPSVITSRSDIWEQALNAKDIDTLVELYTNDTRILAPNREMAQGRDAVRAEFGAMIDAGLSGDLTSVETMVSGDIGYNVGTFTLTSGEDVIDTGKYTEIWHRGEDGEWRIASDIWNSSTAMAAEAEAPMAHTHLMIMHEVEDAEKWLAAWRGEDSRHGLFEENGAKHVHTFQNADNPNLTGLVVAVSDMEALNAMLGSDEGMAAAAEDTASKQTRCRYCPRSSERRTAPPTVT